MKNKQVIFGLHLNRWRSAVVVCLLAIEVLGPGSRSVARAEATKALRATMARIAAQTMPAVVHIESIRRQEDPFHVPEGATSNPSSLEHFLNLANASAKIHQELKILGTGTIIDPLGHVLTNRHVVAGAEQMHVILFDGRKYAARLVGTDSKTDIALIRILTRDPLPYVIFGDSDEVELGETVTAVAHSRPTDLSARQGTILARHGPNLTTFINYKDYFGEEPTVNMAFSGGPLCNLAGKVIAVNVAILSPSARFDGIVLSITSNGVGQAVKHLISGRKAEDAPSALTPQFFSTSLAEFPGMPAISPVRRDEIDPRDTKTELMARGLGHNTSESVSRNETAPVNSLSQSGESEQPPGVGRFQALGEPASVLIRRYLGMAGRTATPKEAQRYHVRLGKPLVINWLDPSGPLARAGVEVNDMLLEIDGRPMGSFDDLMHTVSQMRPRQRVIMVILDHKTGRKGYIQVHTH